MLLRTRDSFNMLGKQFNMSADKTHMTTHMLMSVYSLLRTCLSTRRMKNEDQGRRRMKEQGGRRRRRSGTEHKDDIAPALNFCFSHFSVTSY